MKKTVNEIYWLRCIACLSIVAIHSITSGLEFFANYSSDETKRILSSMQMGLMYATPTFIFISEFLFAKNYASGVPKGFLKTRVKALLIPYVSMGMVFAFAFNRDGTFESFLMQFANNIFLGQFIGYFILIIFQFYFLHMLFYKQLSRWSPKKVLPLAFLVNALYLAVFNFYPVPEGLFYAYIWDRGHWLLFGGWIFYFVLGFYCGKYYDEFKQLLHRYWFVVCALPIFCVVAVIMLRNVGLPEVISSKRIDVMLYTTSFLFFIILVSSKIQRVPSPVLFISKYSFNIYLIHHLIVWKLGVVSHDIVMHMLFVFIFSLLGSIVIASIFSKIPYGHYVVGRVLKVPEERKGHTGVAV
ncbi:acyltransferase family protein [Priestia taiwanensis]|uniref:Membrane-bound acyltransferase YfiQ n=1 Tax=Priestia taiwanensis TaxID=1347902 RepID=A0A917EMB1_9BACI|nr:acyltransferase family protein [Priestia taiwanensis]MBM7361617.1 membrane-bound acyltransferase YfiQ involved in biofilm formation [Priestia taiwanensis]GGE55539.1 putative membrane-bound acyltransferase YfiQ [Priestia taiwanensis]